MNTANPARMSFPGTIHAINPNAVAEDADEVLISSFGRFVRWLGVLFVLYGIIVGINLLMDGITGIGFVNLLALMEYARDPFICLLIGVLATFLVQSSTITTTITVAAVGTGAVTLDTAVMLIMGANIGTCFTVLLVAYSYFRSPPEMNRGLSAALTHWWFNVLACLILYPIEVAFHPLARISALLTDRLLGSSAAVPLPTGGLVSWSVRPLVDALGSHGLARLVGLPQAAAIVCIVVGAVIIACCTQALTVLLRQLMAFSSHRILENSRGSSSIYKGFATGLGLTLLTHSSSATTCASVPFAAAGTLTTRGALGITAGANLGTTLTAVIAAFAVPGTLGSLALEASLVHVLINLLAVIAVLLIPAVASLIIQLSASCAKICASHPAASFAGWLALFIAAPAMLVALIG